MAQGPRTRQQAPGEDPPPDRHSKDPGSPTPGAMGDSEDEEETEMDPMARAMADMPKVVVRKNELREDLYNKLLMICVEGLKKHKLQKDIAQHIKQTLDTDSDFNELIGKGPWQVIVGRSFASAITHEAMHISFFDIPKYQETLLIYKSLGVQSL
uniref:Dynein light chain n=1 Tax=Alexandrium monilatum TaxID=311494 RepID=A0A7S4PSD3_9DINO